MQKCVNVLEVLKENTTLGVGESKRELIWKLKKSSRLNNRKCEFSNRDRDVEANAEISINR